VRGERQVHEAWQAMEKLRDLQKAKFQEVKVFSIFLQKYNL
jgi:hypothetical protein